MTTPTAHRVTVAEFLAMEETKPYRELIDGEVVEKSMPTQNHSNAVLDLGSDLRGKLKTTGQGHVFTELRCHYLPEDRLYLPDVCVFLSGRLPPRDENPVLSVPDFAIEVLSPDDRASRVIEKVQFYMRAGVRLLWLVDPERRAITVHEPGKQALDYTGDTTVSAAPVLPDFEIRLMDLFAD
jgi:Uma2 family endonuclease